ncbi:hypothetical protein EJ02DRAFT_461144 [Clathrospora elynae]|uniref:Uncharacterized protein n=1 Tax=Clathrospora elynae TaxID=706981 RepID=A0A6A5S1H1_9PLEO|nr:hypothetical protein EJ02DRAFT_461144 [Clathrospora elynae]
MVPPSPGAGSINNFVPYLRYLNRLAMPLGVELWEEDDAGKINIMFGERRCRANIGGRVLCSTVVSTRGALKTHAVKQHGMTVAVSENMGKPSGPYLQTVWEFYHNIMDKHDLLAAAEHRIDQEQARLRVAAQAAVNAQMAPVRHGVRARAGQLHLGKMNNVLHALGYQVPCVNCSANFANTRICHFYEDNDNLEDDSCLSRVHWDLEG